ncbi:MAG: hypothetical protein JWO57_436 [Pseudonocardiales bacterium]|nr:hypothetical protein [Pseudonocardiales bacterium]
MTFSIVARDAQTGELGVASQSHYFALGRVVTFAQSGVGAVATQSFVEPAYGPDGLTLMAAGKSAEQSLRFLLAGDDDRELRQVAMVDAAGSAAGFTGGRCVPSRGEAFGKDVIVLGNMLTNDDVVPAMLAAYEATPGRLSDRILAAMDAAEAAGGDARGRMSASLVIVSGERGPRPWSNRLLDVRVDDSEHPLVELRRLTRLSDAHTIFGNSVFTPGLLSSTSPTSGAELDAALAALDSAQRVIGDDPEPQLWKGVLLVRAGDTEQGAKVITDVVETRPQYRAFVDGLHAVGILPASAAELIGDA